MCINNTIRCGTVSSVPNGCRSSAAEKRWKGSTANARFARWPHGRPRLTPSGPRVRPKELARLSWQG
eukprot:5428934-Pyramimonas_sp.AAC.1